MVQEANLQLQLCAVGPLLKYFLVLAYSPRPFENTSHNQTHAHIVSPLRGRGWERVCADDDCNDYSYTHMADHTCFFKRSA